MIVFDRKFDFLDEINRSNSDGLLADDCVLEWPFFSCQGRQSTHKTLKQLHRHCTNLQLIFSGRDSQNNQGTCLYKLTQADKPMLWCGIWITIENDKVQKIKFIFDSYEYFQDDKSVEIFGFHKSLNDATEQPSYKDDKASQDEEVFVIIEAIQQFFLQQYGIPLQDTKIARERLHKTAKNARDFLINNDKYEVILPFFSANEIGPIQFCATIVKTNSSYEVIA